MDRRSFVIGSAAAAAALKTSFAQDAYPTRAITVINPFPPGGAVDVVMRPLAAILEPMVQKPVVIDTKAGAAGQVGAQVAAHAKPDGYTLLSHLTSISGFAEVDRLFGRQPKFTNADFIPLARFVADPCVLVCNDQQPYKTLKEFVEDAKKRPNEIIFSSSGLYGALHIPTALFAAAAGVKLRHLPSQGGGPALTALLGGHVQFLSLDMPAALPQIGGGKVKALGIAAAKRDPLLPDLPTVAESGLPGFEISGWYGIFAPAKTPSTIVSQLSTEIGRLSIPPTPSATARSSTDPRSHSTRYPVRSPTTFRTSAHRTLWTGRTNTSWTRRWKLRARYCAGASPFSLSPNSSG